MGDHSEIQWTDATWNPVTGCSKVSPGCAHCYAEALTMRFAKSWGVPGLPWTPENAEQNVILRPDRLDQPLRWRRPRMIFVNSMSDLFHEQVPDEYIGRVFAVMAASTQHVFQILTKRPERMRDVIRENSWEWSEGFAHGWGFGAGGKAVHAPEWPLPNVWCGTSIENRRFVGRADALRETPAAVRFISAEPLLGPLVPSRPPTLDPTTTSSQWDWDDGTPVEVEGPNRPLDLTDIDWLIVGGESGPKHRPIQPSWVERLRDAALATRRDQGGAERFVGTSFFFKQWGGRTPKAKGRLLDGEEWNEMPVTAREVAA
jgi:protein gp37